LEVYGLYPDRQLWNRELHSELSNKTESPTRALHLIMYEAIRISNDNSAAENNKNVPTLYWASRQELHGHKPITQVYYSRNITIYIDKFELVITINITRR
jgi:hypothetical protein